MGLCIKAAANRFASPDDMFLVAIYILVTTRTEIEAEEGIVVIEQPDVLVLVI